MIDQHSSEVSQEQRRMSGKHSHNSKILKTQESYQPLEFKNENLKSTEKRKKDKGDENQKSTGRSQANTIKIEHDTQKSQTLYHVDIP